MNSDPLNNNKGTRTHPSLERSTSSFSEKERKFVLSNSYWFLFSFFLSFTIDRRKNVHRLFFFLFIDRRLFSDDRSVVVPLPREIHLCFLPLSRVENRWCVAYRDVSPRDTTDRLFSRGNNRSIWTRLSKNFEGWKLIIIMFSIVFFFSRTRPPALEIRQGMNQHRYILLGNGVHREPDEWFRFCFYLGLSDDR